MTIYLRPTSLAEAIKMRADHPDATIFAGGTDVMNRVGQETSLAGMLDLFALDSFVGVSRREQRIQIGAATTFYQIVRDPLVNTHLPILRDSASQIGALQIQNRGTIGGNIGNASPLGDLLPVLLALDAQVSLASTRGERQVPYGEFCTGYRRTVMEPDELIVSVSIPILSDRTFHYWRKVGTRKAQATSKVMLAGVGETTCNRVTLVRLGIGAVADRPIRLTDVEQLLLSKELDHSQVEQARTLTLRSLNPIDDLRSTADYRRWVAANLVAAFVQQLYDFSR